MQTCMHAHVQIIIMDPQQQFCLKWNSYSSNLAMTFSNYFKSDLLADVTLYCGGKYLVEWAFEHSIAQLHLINCLQFLQTGTVFKAHKLILAACSKNFADLFETTPASASCIVILEATSAENMSALLEFMYKGEVHVSQEALNSFLKAAENLQVSLTARQFNLTIFHVCKNDNWLNVFFLFLLCVCVVISTG